MEHHIQSAIDNRNRLKQLLPDSIIVFEGRQPVYRTPDCEYPFRQDSSVLYLTGIDLPDIRFILTPREDILFIPEPHPKKRIWTGLCETVQSAKKRFGFHRVHTLEQFQTVFRKHSRRFSVCYSQKTLISRLKRINPKIRFMNRPLELSLFELRSHKTPREVRFLKHATRLTETAFIDTMEQCEAGMAEYRMKSTFEKSLSDHNTRPAFPTIVASGENASILHYTQYQRVLRRGDLCLIDAGAEHCGYGADISRTFPVGGRFSKRQKALYEIVLETQNHCIAMIKPELSMNALQNACIERIVQGLKALAILKGSVEQIMTRKSYSLFFPHGVSHMLGLDTHDVFVPPKRHHHAKTELRANITLKENFVITVEPGIYFNRFILSDKRIQSRHRDTVNWDRVEPFMNIGGIRIEDNILVTARGSVNLTRLPKTVDSIEAILKNRS